MLKARTGDIINITITNLPQSADWGIFCAVPYCVNRQKRGDLEISPFGFIFAAQTTS